MSLEVGSAAMEATAPMDWDSLTFSLTQTDSMYVAETRAGEPWKNGEVRPYGSIPMSPAAAVLNYGQGCFEGLKAQRTKTGEIVLFRPDRNASRMAAGAARLGMQEVPKDIFLDGVTQVVSANSRWVPPYGKGSLYIRPCLWGSGGILGVAPAPSFTFLIYVSPVGPYFKGELSTISLQVGDDVKRAAPGGQGGVKAIGNYAGGMLPAKKAKAAGHNEVLYLDAVEHRYIEEAGAANFFCVKDGVVYTPCLSTGTILPGITRTSILQIATDLGHKVSEKRLELEFVFTCDEAFCTGTAAVITPISNISHLERHVKYCGGEVGEVTRELYDNLMAIQQGAKEDKHGWVMKLQQKSKL